MNARTLATLAIVTILGADAQLAHAQSAAPVVAPVAAVRRSESAVRQMPIEKRPNRFGHFYGNTVRRRKSGTIFVNRNRTDRPIARYFYLAR